MVNYRRRERYNPCLSGLTNIMSMFKCDLAFEGELHYEESDYCRCVGRLPLFSRG